jgi:uncharacterized membrane protein YeaQ/YmgE (transglycosylase-associated protein family)
MDIITLLIQLVSGALGGNIAGSALKNMSLGTLGNTIAGIVGGGLGGQILDYAFHAPAVGGGPLDWAAILTHVVGGGLGGAVLMAIVGAMRGAMAR